MTQSVAQRAATILENIKQELLVDNPHTENMDDGAIQLKQRLVEDIIVRHLKESFHATAEEEQSSLYKQLALQTHSDKFSDLQPELHDYLEVINATDVFMNTLTDFKDPKINILNDLSSNPMSTIKNISFRTLTVLEPMLQAYKRYPQPIRFLVNAVSWTINIALALAAVALFVVWSVPSEIMSLIAKIEKPFLNWLTRGLYAEINASYLEQHMNLGLQVYGEALRQAMIKEQSKQADLLKATTMQRTPNLFTSIEEDIAVEDPEETEKLIQQTKKDITEKYSKMSTSQLLEEARNNLITDKVTKYNEGEGTYGEPMNDERMRQIEQAVDQEITNEAKNRVPVGATTYYLHRLKALFYSIASPLQPENKLPSLMIKVGQVLLSPLALTYATALVAFDLLNLSVLFGSLALIVAIKAASLVVLNAPLYVIDGLSAASAFLRSEPKATNQVEEPIVEVAPALSQLGGEQKQATVLDPTYANQGSPAGHFNQPQPAQTTHAGSEPNNYNLHGID